MVFIKFPQPIHNNSNVFQNYCELFAEITQFVKSLRFVDSKYILLVWSMLVSASDSRFRVLLYQCNVN